jgi:hypothetical protein
VLQYQQKWQSRLLVLMCIDISCLIVIVILILIVLVLMTVIESVSES